MDLATFLAATLVAHVVFAICVAVHAFATGREAGNWPFITIAFGLAGVAAYLFYDRTDGQI